MLARRRFLALSAASTAVLAVPVASATRAAAAPTPAGDPFASANWRALMGKVVTATNSAGQTVRLRVRGVVVDETTAQGETFRVNLRAAAGPVPDGVYAVTAAGLGRRAPVFLVGARGARGAAASDAVLVVNRSAR